jgi:hypothetical protein
MLVQQIALPLHAKVTGVRRKSASVSDFARAKRLAKTDTSSLEVHPALALRSRRIGHSASLTTFSAIDPKTVGLHPEVP